VTERGDGWYSLAMTTSHTDPLGDLVLRATASGADPIDLREQVFAALPGDSVTLTTAERGDIADKILGRNVSGGSDTGRTVKQALHFLRNKWTVSSSTLTVYDTDDTTSSWTATVASTPGADPITGNDPA
jgi:hypothetical protein